MPSQRSPDKKMFGVYLTKKQRDVLKALADEDGVTMASKFKLLVMDEARRRGIVPRTAK